MTDHKDDLLPCPFCGGTNLQSGGVCFVGFWCLDCEAQGPNHYGRYDWNTRAAMLPDLKELVAAIRAMKEGE